MDIGRLWRALQVRQILRAEDARDAFLAGNYQPSPAEWREIRRNDRLWQSQS